MEQSSLLSMADPSGFDWGHIPYLSATFKKMLEILHRQIEFISGFGEVSACFVTVEQPFKAAQHDK